MKHPGHSQTACVHSKHIGIGNEDTGNDHGAGKTKYNKSVPFLALKTNMLFDIALIPNIEVEVPVGKCWSLNGELMFPWWLFDNDKYCMQILSGGLETRYWLDNKKKRNILTGHFAGLYAGGGSTICNGKRMAIKENSSLPQESATDMQNAFPEICIWNSTSE